MTQRIRFFSAPCLSAGQRYGPVTSVTGYRVVLISRTRARTPLRVDVPSFRRVATGGDALLGRGAVSGCAGKSQSGWACALHGGIHDTDCGLHFTIDCATAQGCDGQLLDFEFAEPGTHARLLLGSLPAPERVRAGALGTALPPASSVCNLGRDSGLVHMIDHGSRAGLFVNGVRVAQANLQVRTHTARRAASASWRRCGEAWYMHPVLCMLCSHQATAASVRLWSAVTGR